MVSSLSEIWRLNNTMFLLWMSHQNYLEAKAEIFAKVRFKFILINKLIGEVWRNSYTTEYRVTDNHDRSHLRAHLNRPTN